jgi:hypothetical protein
VNRLNARRARHSACGTSGTRRSPVVPRQATPSLSSRPVNGGNSLVKRRGLGSPCAKTKSGIGVPGCYSQPRQGFRPPVAAPRFELGTSRSQSLPWYCRRPCGPAGNGALPSPSRRGRLYTYVNACYDLQSCAYADDSALGGAVDKLSAAITRSRGARGCPRGKRLRTSCKQNID